ncbi:hypothetical protein HN789_02015 [archaeon]|jgi:hypothetical protein|nr:hypothetical protein [archaeon]MBT4021837.1 hypothetical protein [archaeon]MBT4272132.1 hypothetical protein [archaeon]MBT4460313.1 hypothetical protein [archaeon]MBT4858937.1 hypothetical protein [archaeon]
MGVLSWLKNIFKGLFKIKNIFGKFNSDFDFDRRLIGIDQRKKRTARFENEAFKELSDAAHEIFDYINKHENAKSFQGELYNFLEQVQDIRDSSGITVQLNHYRKLVSVWRELNPHLQKNFGADAKIIKASKIVNQQLMELGKELNLEMDLLNEEKHLAQQKLDLINSEI